MPKIILGNNKKAGGNPAFFFSIQSRNFVLLPAIATRVSCHHINWRLTRRVRRPPCGSSPGTDPGIHLTIGTVLVSLWIAGSSPVMTVPWSPSPSSGTACVPFAITPNEAPLLPLFDKRGRGELTSPITEWFLSFWPKEIIVKHWAMERSDFNFGLKA